MATTQSADDSTDSEALEAARDVERQCSSVDVKLELDGEKVRVISDSHPPLEFDKLIREHGFLLGHTTDDGRITAYQSI